MLKYLRNIIKTFIIVTLFITNIVTLLYQPFTNALSQIATAVLGISTVTSVLQDSISSKDNQIKSQQKKIAAINQQHLRQKSAVKKFGQRIMARMRKLAITNTSGSIAEMIPILGIGAVVAGAGYEVYEYCQMSDDIQQLYQEAGIGEVEESDIMKEVCMYL